MGLFDRNTQRHEVDALLAGEFGEAGFRMGREVLALGALGIQGGDTLATDITLPSEPGTPEVAGVDASQFEESRLFSDVGHSAIGPELTFQ